MLTKGSIAVPYLLRSVNTLQILNVLRSDPFTNTVFKDVLPSDRLPIQITKRPRSFILNMDPSDRPGTNWVAIYLYQAQIG